MNKTQAENEGFKSTNLFFFSNKRKNAETTTKDIHDQGFEARIVTVHSDLNENDQNIIGLEIYACKKYFANLELQILKKRKEKIPSKVEQARIDYQNAINKIEQEQISIQNDIEKIKMILDK